MVSYLRMLNEPARQRFYPGRPAGEMFPLLTLEQARETRLTGTLAVEIGREAATLVMLAAVALAVSTTGGQWAAAFAIGFGVWDLMFYVFLKVLLGWPASLLTWDILFLVPVPWVGPVLAPSLVAASMVLAGIWHFQREEHGPAVRIRLPQWAGMLLGATVIIVSFTLDYRHVMAGGMPHPFHWGVFTLGMAIGLCSYVYAVVTSHAAKHAASAHVSV